MWDSSAIYRAVILLVVYVNDNTSRCSGMYVCMAVLIMLLLLIVLIVMMLFSVLGAWMQVEMMSEDS